MEIYDDPNRVYPQRPPAQVYDRRYRKNASGMELFLIGGVLFLFLGGIALLFGLADLFALPNSTTVFLLAGSLPQFLAGGLGIKLRHYPGMAGLCFKAALLAAATCLVWLFMTPNRMLGIFGLFAALTYGIACLSSHR